MKALLEDDPYAKNSNAKRLKNVRQSFRMRIGKDVRMLYRVDSQRQRVELFGIGPRGEIYDHFQEGERVVLGASAETVHSMLKNGEDELTQPDLSLVKIDPADPPDIEVEVLPWLVADDLFLLHVPEKIWPAVLDAKSLEGLQQTLVPNGIKQQIEDYWTNPQATQVDKLYTLADGQGMAAIARQPLSAFLLALDPEQKRALARIRSDGPYLLKGSAGTGKSLVGLYHLRDLIIVARAGASLFDGTSARYGVITYTNTLVDASLAILHSLTPANSHATITCSTLDGLVYQYAEKALGAKPSALNTDGMSRWINEHIAPKLPVRAAAVLKKLGADYVADDIEQVIHGNGLINVDEYIAVGREGRRRGLTAEERRNLWIIHEALQALLVARHTQTFGQWRRLALSWLRDHPGHPRYAALFVDEAQDFSKVARQFCLELVQDPKHLVLAADTGQSIYTVPPSWKQCDVRFDFVGRKPIPLSRSYRATTEISRAIAPLRNDPGDADDHSTNAMPVFGGPKPRWLDVGKGDHVAVVAAEIEKLVKAADMPIHAGQIAIIVRDKVRASQYEAALKIRGVSAMLIQKGSPLQLAGHTVHIVTAHSSKGLGFPVVFVPDIHASAYPAAHLLAKAKDDKQHEQIVESEQRLLYVALSRASHRLTMVTDTSHPSPFVSLLDRKAHWD
ncbi:MAG: hypothetical protein RLY71_3904 [Pseudomonadota bacterium]